MSHTYDVIVIGGGIHGCGIARDAALRGLRIALFERGDIAGQTSSRSSKLVHGGIRYLETLQIALVREALAERAHLLRLAPHLVWPLPFLLPYYEGQTRPRWYLEAGLHLYDQLAGEQRIERLRTLTREEALTLEPNLPDRGLKGAGLFLDAQMDDARLCLENAIDAAEIGAEIFVHHDVTKLERAADRWVVTSRDMVDPDADLVVAQAPVVVNAAGPWVDHVRSLTGREIQQTVRTSQGTHIMVGSLTRKNALLLTTRSDARVFFVMPQRSGSLIGTTETDPAQGPGAVRPTPDEVRYLVDEVRDRWPQLEIESKHVQRAFAGVRPLVRARGALGKASREERILREDGLFSVVGGKYTTYRAVSERVMNRVSRFLGQRGLRCLTKESPLGGSGFGTREQAAHMVRMLSVGEPLVSETDAARLGARYGSRFAQMAEHLEENREAIVTGEVRILEAEVAYSVRVELARRLDDVLFRRIGLWDSRHDCRLAAEPVSRWMARQMDWSESRRRSEVEEVMQRLDCEEETIQTALAS